MYHGDFGIRWPNRYVLGALKQAPLQSKGGSLSVEVVGYDTDKDGHAYWTVKAPWGKNFGVDGFVQIAKDHGNACGIASEWAYPMGVKYTPPPPTC
jgi:hypothetical protein